MVCNAKAACESVGGQSCVGDTEGLQANANADDQELSSGFGHRMVSVGLAHPPYDKVQDAAVNECAHCVNGATAFQAIAP